MGHNLPPIAQVSNQASNKASNQVSNQIRNQGGNQASANAAGNAAPAASANQQSVAAGPMQTAFSSTLAGAKSAQAQPQQAQQPRDNAPGLVPTPGGPLNIARNGLLAQDANQPDLLTAAANTIQGLSNELPGIFSKPSPPPDYISPELAATGQKYLGFSLAAYGDESKVGSEWRRVPQEEIGNVNLNNSSTGVQAKVFENQQTGEVVLAYRGTDFSDHGADVIADVAGMAGLVPQSGTDAIDIAKAVKAKYGERLTITGHSLGGAYSTAAGLATGTKAYSFDPPGFGTNLRQYVGEDNIAKNQHLITNFNGQGNFVTDWDRNNDTDTLGGKLIGESYFYSTDNSNVSGPLRIFGLVDGIESHNPKTQYNELQALATGQPYQGNNVVDTLEYLGNFFVPPSIKY